ncbi:sphingosine-1-phosphate lyase-like [Brevipalpus obovatus]|uniref:sphingosine-1-phosphate lyase-like n=1 Tax=Brevipalpus obovatus TaxID=246614 RepID=UPI003D9FA4F6
MDQIVKYFDIIHLEARPYLDTISRLIDNRRRAFNENSKDFDNFSICVSTVIISVLTVFIYQKIIRWFEPDLNETLWYCLKRRFTKIVLNTPILKNFANREISKFMNIIDESLMSVYKNESFQVTLPSEGKTPQQVMREVERYLSIGTVEWEKGRVSGAIYCDLGNGEFIDLMTSVYGKTAYTNPLHADVYPGIRKMEAEVVRMTCSLFKGGPESCGCISTGGTESLILVVKAYRDYARNVKGIKNPEIIAPVSAHPAFDKAASLLRVQLHKIKLDPHTKKVDTRAMRQAINGNTCLLIGSAPCYPYGTYDPIEEIAALGLKRGIPVHVDACLGGFLNPFVEEAGYKLHHRCDFSVPGVTSITADTHKYGCAPKGTSVVVYAEQKYRHQQYFITTDWPGGLYACATIPGSRPGGLIADCWASLMYHGRKRFVENTRKILQVSQKFVREINSIEGIQICGSPELSVVAVASDEINIYMLSDGLTSRGWNVNALQFPSAFHICFTLMHTREGVLAQLVDDIRDITKELMRDRTKSKKLEGQSALYGVSQTIPDRSLVSTFALQYLDSYYNTRYDGNTNGTSH